MYIYIPPIQNAAGASSIYLSIYPSISRCVVYLSIYMCIPVCRGGRLGGARCWVERIRRQTSNTPDLSSYTIYLSIYISVYIPAGLPADKS